MVAQRNPIWTEESYLAFERASDIRHEYVHGEVYAMAGASVKHNTIVTNVTISLGSQLRGKPCSAMSSDMRLKTPTRMYAYPDVVVVCGKPELDDTQHVDTLLNPTLITEVLSPSTEAFDRGKKFMHYQSMTSLQEYLLIAQDEMRIDHYRRQADGKWLFESVTTQTGTLSLESIGCTLALADVYDKASFDIAR
jgi:Uma2 family endonuclease